MNDYLHLVQLAEIDWQKHSIVCEMDTANDGRTQKKELDLLAQRVAQLELSAKKLNSQLEDLKFEEGKSQTEKKKMDSQLFSTGITPKTISDIQTRLEKVKKFLDELETKELELMDQLDSLNRGLSKHKETLDVMRGEYEKTVAGYKRITTKGEEKILELDILREQVREKIDKPNLALYDKLFAQKSGMAMVEIVNNQCQGCCQTVSVALLQALKEDPEELHYCNNCGRLVYVRRTVT